MKNIRDAWKAAVAEAVAAVLKDKGADASLSSSVAAESPPDPRLGDIGFPMFPFSKALRMGPPQIAAAVAERRRWLGLLCPPAPPGQSARTSMSRSTGHR